MTGSPALMIVNEFDAFRAIVPDKTEAPLIVDTDAVLPFSIASQGFQTIARRTSQIVKPSRRVHHIEFS